MFGNNHVNTDKERDELIDDIDKTQTESTLILISLKRIRKKPSG